VGTTGPASPSGWTTPGTVGGGPGGSRSAASHPPPSRPRPGREIPVASAPGRWREPHRRVPCSPSNRRRRAAVSAGPPGVGSRPHHQPPSRVRRPAEGWFRRPCHGVTQTAVRYPAAAQDRQTCRCPAGGAAAPPALRRARRGAASRSTSVPRSTGRGHEADLPGVGRVRTLEGPPRQPVTRTSARWAMTVGRFSSRCQKSYASNPQDLAERAAPSAEGPIAGTSPAQERGTMLTRGKDGRER